MQEVAEKIYQSQADLPEQEKATEESVNQVPMVSPNEVLEQMVEEVRRRTQEVFVQATEAECKVFIGAEPYKRTSEWKDQPSVSNDFTAEATYGLGDALFEKGSHREALQQFQAVADFVLSTEVWLYSWSHYQSGLCYLKLGDALAAKKEFFQRKFECKFHRLVCSGLNAQRYKVSMRDSNRNLSFSVIASQSKKKPHWL